MGISNSSDRRRRESLVACLVTIGAALAAFPGCDSGPPKPDAATQASVSGSVSNNGKPIGKDSSVVFYCSEKAATAAGKIDALGKFVLKEADPKMGIPAGRYQVMVRPPDEPTVAAAPNSADYTKMMQGAGASTARPEKPSDIPQKFQAFDTSGIELELKSGPNTLDIDLAKVAQ